MKYIFIRENRGSFPVSLLCQTLGVGKSGFYTWLNRPVSPRSLENRRLLMEIKVVHKKSRKTYGSPRVHADLNETGHVCSKHRVARLMRENGIVSKHKKMFNVTTSVYQNKCVNGIFKKLKNNLVAEPVGPVKNGFLFFTSP